MYEILVPGVDCMSPASTLARRVSKNLWACPSYRTNTTYSLTSC